MTLTQKLYRPKLEKGPLLLREMNPKRNDLLKNSESVRQELRQRSMQINRQAALITETIKS